MNWLLLFVPGSLLLLALTLIPLWRHQAWWVRGMDFPRVQFLLLAVALGAGEMILLDLALASSRALLLVALACMVYQAWWILPYTRLFPVEVSIVSQPRDVDRVAIMTANVLTTNRNASALIALVKKHQPDLLVTLESDRWWQSQLEVLETDYPHRIKCPLDNLYGMHLYSRIPLREPSIDYLVEDDVPSMHAVVKLRNGVDIRIHCLHPAPPSPTENPCSSERDAELIMVGKSVAVCKLPVIVCGDLNDVAWSETTRLFRRISGLFDPRVGRGIYNSFHAEYWFIRWPLDHLFHSRHFLLEDIRRLPSFGSDHFAILTRLVYSGDAINDGKASDASQADLDRARQKMSNQDAHESDVPDPD